MFNNFHFFGSHFRVCVFSESKRIYYALNTWKTLFPGHIHELQSQTFEICFEVHENVYLFMGVCVIRLVIAECFCFVLFFSASWPLSFTVKIMIVIIFVVVAAFHVHVKHYFNIHS